MKIIVINIRMFPSSFQKRFLREIEGHNACVFEQLPLSTVMQNPKVYTKLFETLRQHLVPMSTFGAFASLHSDEKTICDFEKFYTNMNVSKYDL